MGSTPAGPARPMAAGEEEGGGLWPRVTGCTFPPCEMETVMGFCLPCQRIPTHSNYSKLL